MALENINILFSSLEAICSLSIPFRKALEGAAQIRLLQRKATLLSEGGIQHSLWFIIQGYAREYQNDPLNWAESTNWFWQSGEFVFHNGLLKKQRSEVSIDFYSGAIIFEIDLISLSENLEISEELNSVITTLLEFNTRLRAHHIDDLLKLNRRDHVKKFYSKHQMLFNFVRHKDLASFFRIRDKSIYRYLKHL
ncbi:MAG: hypothetical protein EOO20_15630 [Chryseobacterium sp.]|nr:MAG: hypothetical protein EOO20_15630 [Chryseobacterium sp.]